MAAGAAMGMNRRRGEAGLHGKLQERTMTRPGRQREPPRGVRLAPRIRATGWAVAEAVPLAN